MSTQQVFARPIYLLRAEGFCFLITSCIAYHFLFPHHWLMFAGLFLIPDLSLIPYVKGPSALASVGYNLMHSYTLPALLGILAVLLWSALLGEMSLIWFGHIGMDRALGFGLKYPTSFQFTHIHSAANPVIPLDLPRAQNN